ncbi:MAG: hypothetical protein HOO96_22680 [Polyangiaceae bacterium]|nr:hypothetical protein [Polyangiaceae bacterium]
MTARAPTAAILATLLGACSSPQPRPLPSAATAATWQTVHVQLPPETRKRLETDVAGTWITQQINGDTVTVVTSLEAQGGVLRELRRTIQMGGPRDPAPEVVGSGRYAIGPEGSLDIFLEASHRRSFFTVLPSPRGAILVTELARGDGQLFRYSVAEERSGHTTTKVDLAWSFASPLADVLGKGAPCVVEMHVVASAETRGDERWKCHMGAPARSKLVPVILDGARYQSSGASEIREVVERAVNAPLWFDPAMPTMLFMGALGFDDLPYGWLGVRSPSKSP